jgi:anti-anti-sigma factor
MFAGTNGRSGPIPVGTVLPSERHTWRLTITREVEQGVLIVTVAGRLGTASSGVLVETLVQAIRDGHRRILCDLEGVDYASSAGLRALDAISGRMHAAGGDLVLCSLSEPVRAVFELSDLLAHFAIEPSRDAGIARASRTRVP